MPALVNKTPHGFQAILVLAMTVRKKMRKLGAYGAASNARILQIKIWPQVDLPRLRIVHQELGVAGADDFAFVD